MKTIAAPAASTAFAMFGRYNGNAGTSNGTLSFGWTRAGGEFNPFNGAGTGVAATDHVIVGVARDAGNAFRLSAVNGAHGQMNSGNLFGTTAASLTGGNSGGGRMGQATITINGRTYRLKCADGEEARLLALSDIVRQRVDNLAGEFSAAGDDRLLLMAALMLADELLDAQARLKALGA